MHRKVDTFRQHWYNYVDATTRSAVVFPLFLTGKGVMLWLHTKRYSRFVW